MLDPEYLRRLTEGSEQIASLLHTELVKIIVQAIVTRMERGDSYRLTARDRWMLEVLQAAGYLRQDLEREIAAKTKLMLQEMKEAFEDAGVRSLAWDDAVYIAAGLEPTPLRQSPQLIRLLERGYEKTAGEWVNFTGTTANASQQLFIRECDKAYNLVASGGMSHAQAVRQAVETVAREGVRVTYPTGHTDTVETAVARAVRTGVGQACGEMSMARMREMGWKIVLVSAHLGARTGDGGENHTNHFWWQGKFYRLDDEDRSGTEDAAQPQQNEAEHPKTAAGETGNDEPQEMTRRKIGTRGQEIIDKPTYQKLTRDFIRRGGIIIRGEEAAKHLDAAGAYASYVTGGNIAYIRDDATITDVVEEMYHAEQDRKHMYGERVDRRVYFLREIDAQKYLLSAAEKYKIPLEEQEATRKMLVFYEERLAELEKE